MLIPAPKICVFGKFWPQNIFVIESSKRHFLGQNRAFWATKHHYWSSGPTGMDKKTKKQK